MKTTYRELINFTNAASLWLSRNAKEPPTKLSYAAARVCKHAEKLIADFNDKFEDSRLEHCLTDEKTGAILQEGQNFKFDREGLKAITKARRELLESEVEIEPYFATELPPALPDEVRVAFEGFVIKPEDEPA